MTLAELVIKLSANTATLEKDFSKATRMAENFASMAKKAFAGLGVGLSVAGLSKLVTDAAAYGEEISMAAQKTAMTTQEISRLRFAAGLSGIEFNALQKSIEIFSRNLAGLEDSNSRASKALKALGIEQDAVRSGALSMHDLFLRIAKRVSEAGDSYEKTAILMAAFGKQGASLLPLFNQGAEGIERLEKQADILGLTLDKKTAAALSECDDALDMFKGALKGAEIQIVNATIPALNDLLVRLLALREEGKVFGKSWLKDVGIGTTVALSAIPTAFANIVNWSGEASDSLFDWASKEAWANREGEGLTQRIIEIGAALKGLSSKGTAEGFKLDLSKPVKEAKSDVAETARLFGSLSLEVYATDAAYREYLKTLSEINKLSDEHSRDVLAALNEQRLAQAISKAGTELAQDQEEFYRKASASVKDFALDINSESDAYDRLSRAVDNVNAKSRAMHEEWMKSTALARAAAQAFADTFERGIEEMIFSGRTFREVLAGILEDLGRIILRAALLGPLEKFFAGLFGGGGALGMIFGGGKAAGGPVASGTPYLVGEEGPELFVPSAAGAIIPHGAAMGGTVIYQVDARGADISVERRVMRALRLVHQSAVRNAQTEMQDRALRAGA